MEDRAAELVAEHGGSLSMQVVDEEEMIEKGMGLIYGVGKAAPSGPRIVYISYKGNHQSIKVAYHKGGDLMIPSIQLR